MPASAASPATCTSCGTTAPMHTMLMNDQGALTCGSCLARVDAQSGLRKRAKNVMLTPAMVSVLGWFALLVPMVGIVLPGLMAAGAILGAVAGIRLYGELGRRRDDHGVSAGLRSGVLVMSILTIVFASILLVIQVFAWIGLALMPSHPRPAGW